MKKTDHGFLYLFLTALTVSVLFASLYFQYVVGMHPCPLCLMQRLCVFLLLCTLLLELKVTKRAHQLSIVHMVVSGAGLFFSSRQIWLQNLPPGKVPTCMPGLDVLIKYFPLQTVARALFWGAADCAEVTWKAMGLSMAGWSAMYFLFMLAAGAILYFRTQVLK